MSHVLRLTLWGIVVAPLLTVRPAASHSIDETPLQPDSFWLGWNLDPWLLAGFALAIVLYGFGLYRLFRQAGPGRGVRFWQIICYATGILSLLVALISPLDALGKALSAAHMAQHLLLIVVAAPLLVLARPLPVYLWALPLTWRLTVAAGTKRHGIARTWHVLTKPITVWVGYSVTLWAWHAPPLYETALKVSLVHDLEHLSFLVTALLFWWVVFQAASGIALLFTTMLHSGLLGALMTFAPIPWYRAYAESTFAWGFTPPEDQQLAGLIMWVPGGIPYLLASLAILGRWLMRLETDERRRNLQKGKG